MGYRYCPKCKEVVLAKALPVGYKHHQYRDIRAKVRKVIHREEDGGCGTIWDTLEVPYDMLIKNDK